MESSVALRVNARNLVNKHLKNAFTSRSTYLRELLQNARRAGASRVILNHNQETGVLSIADDGGGIGEMQSLLSLGDSAWDDTVQDVEMPYGMGFMSALFQAEEVVVDSGDAMMMFKTRDVLDFKDVEVLKKNDHLHGTHIELKGIGPLDETDVKSIVRGFDLPVFYNGREMERPHAIDVLSDRYGEDYPGLGRAPELGWYCISRIGMPLDKLAISLEKSASENYILYLQGIEVARSFYRVMSGEETVIHLDPRHFIGRMPDRDQLIDEAEKISLINAFINLKWYQWLTDLIETGDQETLARYIYPIVKKRGHLSMLNQLDYLPVDTVGYQTEYPCFEYDGLGSYSINMTSVNDSISREAVESGEVKLLDFQDGNLDKDAFLCETYAYLSRAPVLKNKLDPDHWVHKHLIPFEEADIKVVTQGDTKETSFTLECISGNLVICDQLFLEGPLGRFESDVTFAYPSGTVYSPVSDTMINLGYVIFQCSAYMNEFEQLEESKADSDEYQMNALIRSLREEDPAQLLQEVMRYFGNTYPLLRGHSLKVSFDPEGKLTVMQDAS